MGGNALLLKHAHEMIGDQVVYNAFAANRAALRAVSGGGVILILDNVKVGVVGFEYLLCFSFIKQFPFFHASKSSLPAVFFRNGTTKGHYGKITPQRPCCLYNDILTRSFPAVKPILTAAADFIICCKIAGQSKAES